MSTEEPKKSSSNSDRLIGGLIVLGIGITFLLMNLDVLPGLSESWPLFLVIVGVAIIAGSLRRGKK